MAAMTRRLPIPRVGEPDEVAEAYLYLLKAGYTTGQILHGRRRRLGGLTAAPRLERSCGRARITEH